MSINNYLRPDEKILHSLEIRTGDKKILKDIVGVTEKRVFHFRNLKGYDLIYRDIPLTQVKYLENAWHSINIVKLIIAIILIIIGVGLIFTPWLFYFIAPILLIVGIILLVKALKQNGYFLINGDDWKFEFRKRDNIKTIEKIIQEIYYLIST